MVDASGPHHTPAPDPYAAIVYGARASDVRATVIDGQLVARSGAVTWADWGDLRSAADRASHAVRSRAGV